MILSILNEKKTRIYLKKFFDFIFLSQNRTVQADDVRQGATTPRPNHIGVTPFAPNLTSSFLNLIMHFLIKRQIYHNIFNKNRPWPTRDRLHKLDRNRGWRPNRE